MTYCGLCGGFIPDYGGHSCTAGPYWIPSIYYPYPISQKCDVCGSTAVDHTEAQCQINRGLKEKK